MRKWLEKCEKLVGKNQRTNWPKLQAQKLEPIETETNGFFNYFGRFQLRLLQIENFSFGWPDKKKKPIESNRLQPWIEGSWGYKGGFLPGVAREYCGGKKEERQMEGLC